MSRRHLALLVGELPLGDALGAVAVVGTAFCYAAAGLWKATFSLTALGLVGTGVALGTGSPRAGRDRAAADTVPA